MTSKNNKIFWKIIALISVLFTSTAQCQSQKTYWCVQIATSTNLLQLKNLYEKIKTFNNARIEKIESLYTIRIGFYHTKQEAIDVKDVLNNQGFNDAIVRKCFFIKDRILYSTGSEEAATKEFVEKQVRTADIIKNDTSIATILEKPAEDIAEKQKTVEVLSSETKTDTVLLEQEKKLEKIVSEIKHLFSSKEKEIPTDTTFVDSIFAIPEYEPSSVKAGINLQQKKMEAEKNNMGLKLTSQYVFNQNTGLIEDEDVLSYKWRGYIGLEWDILRDGLKEHQSKKEQLDKQIEIENLLAPQRIRHEMYPFYRNEIICMFNKEKKKLLEKKIGLLSQYEQVIENLYFASMVQKEDVQNIKKEIERAKSMLEGYDEYEGNLLPAIKEKANQFEVNCLPYFDIRIKDIQRIIESPETRDKILSLQKSIISEKYRHTYDARFSPFLRYYFGKTDTGKKNINDYFTLGFNFSIPIPFSEEKTISVQTAEEKFLEETYDRIIRDTLHDVTNSYYEYVYKIDDLIKFLYQKQTILEQIRKQLVKFDMKDESFSISDLISAVIQYLNTEFEILHIKQLLYLNFASIVKYLPEQNVSQFIVPLNIEKDIIMKSKIRTGERSVYIWSEAFNRLDNKVIYWFLKAKSVNYALVSIGRNTDREKLKKFLDLVGDSLKIEALIGDNELLKQKEKLGIIVSEINTYKLSGIHLDIEPYTFADWEQNRQQYLQLYLELIQMVKNHPLMKNKTISVSVPIFYTEDFLRKLVPMVNEIYVMAYETKKPETIARWIQKAIDADKTKVVVALRCKDFANEMEMENVIKEVEKLTGISNFAIHSLKEYLEIGGNYEIEK
ncbi:MAG TPA: SPOR domain-containing protein [bacterium]|nr:SPOR domain-containing protein [bacterium]HOL35542.1 SPOR domain-containing protein [bacterium]HPP07965.1 SPOR domain-containing protein [bacterium]